MGYFNRDKEGGSQQGVQLHCCYPGGVSNQIKSLPGSTLSHIFRVGHRLQAVHGINVLLKVLSENVNHTLFETYLDNLCPN